MYSHEHIVTVWNTNKAHSVHLAHKVIELLLLSQQYSSLATVAAHITVALWLIALLIELMNFGNS